MQVAVVIATYGRPSELERVLAGIHSSNLPIPTVVVVDSSEGLLAEQTKSTVRKFSEFGVEYVHTEIKSANVQRNLGISKLDLQHIDFIQILDDDTVPSPDYIERLAALISSDDSIVGASGTTRSVSRRTRMQSLKALPFVFFGLESFKYGSRTSAGVGMPPNPDWKTPHEVEWLFGCSMWRKSIFEKISYESSLVGSCLFDDVLFSSKALKHGKLLLDPGAYLHHLFSSAQRPSDKLHYYRYSRNRWFVVRESGRVLSKVSYFASVLFLATHFFARYLIEKPSVRSSMKENAWATLQGCRDAMLGKAPI